MASQYGLWRLDGDTSVRIRPQRWDDVVRAYTIDEALTKREKKREAVRRATRFVIPVQEEIYRGLRRGALEASGRPNGSGDFVRIAPIQWMGPRIRSFEGRDIAVPVDSGQNPLPLRRPLADYVTGLVPTTSMPTVWPDPPFPAEQAARLWPAGEPKAGGIDGVISPPPVRAMKSSIEPTSPLIPLQSEIPAAVPSAGPKGRETKAASVAWEIVEQILGDKDTRPARGHGRLRHLQYNL